MKCQGQPLLTPQALSGSATNEGIERALVIVYLFGNAIHWIHGFFLCKFPPSLPIKEGFFSDSLNSVTGGFVSGGLI